MVVINERGPYVLQGVTTQSIPAGRAVTVVSGQSNLLSVSLAPANAAAGSVFVAVIPPDNFPKPARAGMYTNRGTSLVNVDSGTPGPDTEARYNFTPSLEEYTTIPSGWFVQLHRNCVVTVPAGAFNDNENIRVAGATVAVAASGVWTQSAANVVGMVVHYSPERLTIALH